MEKQEAKQLCEKHKYRYVRVWTDQGTMHDGFIEHVDDEKMYLAIPVGHENMQYQAKAPCHHHHMHHPAYVHGSVGTAPQANANMSMHPNANMNMHPNANMNYPYYETRAFFPGYFYPPYGYGYGYGYPGRFNRLVLPLAALTAISLLPFF